MTSKFVLKVFATTGGHHAFTFRAPSGCGFTEEGIQLQLSDFMETFEKQFPGANYRVVRIGKASFNALPSLGNA